MYHDDVGLERGVESAGLVVVVGDKEQDRRRDNDRNRTAKMPSRHFGAPAPKR